MNLKQAKRLRALVKLQDCASIETLHTFSSKRGQTQCIIVWPSCRRGIYLAAKKQLKRHNFNLVQFEGICL